MSEVQFAVGDADTDLQERLDTEINTFNAAATGHYDARELTLTCAGEAA